MLLTLAIILAVGWLLGLVAFNVTSSAIHLILFIAIVAAVLHFVNRGRTTVSRV